MSPKTIDRGLILASTSSYRRALLARLQLPFSVCAPEFDEVAPGNLPAAELVRHNTLGKARSLISRHPLAAVIASDQVAVCGDAVLGKPGNHDATCRQLRLLSGRDVDFLTGVALIDRQGERYRTVTYRVRFRRLSPAAIDTYVRLEKPYDCAGGFKSEGLGICLFERMQGDDPTALVGLPLITLCTWLEPLSRRAEGHGSRAGG